MTAPLPPDARVVVIGTGQGGFQLAASLRQEGFAGSVTLIGEEPGLPYQRPPLSKAYMADGDAERLLLKPAGFYARSAITLIDRTRASRIDRDARTVHTADGAAHPYDHLVLATGARPFRPPVEGLDGPDTVELRTLADAALLRGRLARTRHAIVIGGGFIGLEFAAMARAAGVDVTVLEAAPRLMARALSPALSDWFLAAHRAMGTEVLLGVGVAAVETGQGVRLTDGRNIAGDLILAATGVRPNVELAEEAGLAVQNGVVVDGRLVSADPAISALGDCAAFPLADGARVRLESVQAAVDHARHIARRLVKGATGDYAAVPWFWSDQGKHKLQIAGLGAGADEVLSLPQSADQPVMLLFRAGRLAAVETVNAPAQHLAARKLIGTPREELEEVGFDLKEALRTTAR